MRPRLSTTTALVTSIALAMPVTFPFAPARAQQDNVCTDEMTAEQCAEAQAAAEANGAVATEPEAEAEAEAEAQVEAEVPEAEAEAQATETAPAAEAEVVAEEPVVEPEPTPAPEAQATETAPEAPANGAVTDAEDLAERLGAEAGAEAEAEAQVEAEVEAEAETETQAEAEVETQTEAEAETEAQAEIEPTPVPENGQAEATEEAPAEEGGVLNTLERALGGVLGGDQPEREASASGFDGEATIDGEAPQSEAELDAATGEAEESMAASDNGDAEVVDEVTETVTEESARRSDEPYAEAETQARPQGERRRNDDDDGPTFLQGALLGAAGALVVGALLNDNREVVASAPDRVVVRDQRGRLQVLRDDDAILRQPGSEVRTRTYRDGSTDTIVLQRDGTQVITVRNPEGRVIKRVVVDRDGRESVLFDDTRTYEPVVIDDLPEPVRRAAPQVDPADEEALRVALMQEASVGRSFSLNQVRQIDRVRYLAPSVQVENITFASGSAAISPSEAQELLQLGQLMGELIAENPNEVFLIEGHTDAVGAAAMNLALSDRRAESVARALTEYFGVSPANMVLQGYGESDLRVQTLDAERENRRVVVRRITPLLQIAQN